MGSKCGKKAGPQPGLNASRMEHALEAHAKNEELREEFERWLKGRSNYCILERTKRGNGDYSDRTVALMFNAFKEGRCG